MLNNFKMNKVVVFCEKNDYFLKEATPTLILLLLNRQLAGGLEILYVTEV
jgi:hypothetical protein